MHCACKLLVTEQESDLGIINIIRNLKNIKYCRRKAFNKCGIMVWFPARNLKGRRSWVMLSLYNSGMEICGTGLVPLSQEGHWITGKRSTALSKKDSGLKRPTIWGTTRVTLYFSLKKKNYEIRFTSSSKWRSLITSINILSLSCKTTPEIETVYQFIRYGIVQLFQEFLSQINSTCTGTTFLRT